MLRQRQYQRRNLGNMKSICGAICWLLALSHILIGSSSALKCDRCHRTEKCTVKECPSPGKYGPFLCASFGKRELSKGKGCFLKRLMEKAFTSDDECRDMNGAAILWLLFFEGEFGDGYTYRSPRSVQQLDYLTELFQQTDDDEKAEIWRVLNGVTVLTEEEWLQDVEKTLEAIAKEDSSQVQIPTQQQKVQIHLKRKTNYTACSCSQDSCNNNDWIDEQNGNSGIKGGGKKNQANCQVAPGAIFLAFASLVVDLAF